MTDKHFDQPNNQTQIHNTYLKSVQLKAFNIMFFSYYTYSTMLQQGMLKLTQTSGGITFHSLNHAFFVCVAVITFTPFNSRHM